MIFLSSEIKGVANLFTIRFKLVLSCALVFAVLMGGIAFNVYESFERAIYTTQKARMDQYAERLIGEIAEQQGEENTISVNELQRIKPEGLGRTAFRLFNSSGNPIYSDTILSGQAVEQWSQVLKNRVAFETVHIKGNPYRSLWTPVEVEDKYQYVLQVASSLEDPETSLDHLRLLFLVTIPVGLALFAFAVNAIVSRGLATIENIIRTASTISGNHLNSRIALPKGKDEVYALSATLNEMLDRLDASFRSQKQFIADASHEIRTPLTILTSEIEFTLRRLRDRKSRESLTISLAEIGQLNKLVNDLLMLAKLDAISAPHAAKRVRLDSLIVTSLRRMESLANSKGVTFDVNIPRGVQINADKEKLATAFANLFDNAIKFSYRGDTVTVLLEVKEPLAVITIQDHGVGISKADLPLVFDRFHRGEIPRSQMVGDGLGLAIVKTIIEYHKGRIRVESEPGKGSTFIVELPVTSAVESNERSR